MIVDFPTPLGPETIISGPRAGGFVLPAMSPHSTF
jgi:hypothetical protein